MREMEGRIILDSLHANQWNRKRTARALKISYRSLLYKLKKAGIQNRRDAGPVQAGTKQIGEAIMKPRKTFDCRHPLRSWCLLRPWPVRSRPRRPSPPLTADAHNAYVIGESDLLAINVWHEPELTRVVPVRTDGKITMPLIGELQASGQTVEELRATIAVELAHFLEAPEVTVIVQEPRSQFFTIVGKVVRSPDRIRLGSG